jgi:predicted dienelactone hydrolase
MYLKSLLAALGVCLSISSFAQTAQTDAPLQAGFRTMTVAAAEPIPVALFYPTAASANTIPMGPYAVTVAFGGTPPAKVKGLILISHGTGGSELGHHNLAQTLAQSGYLVAAIQHPRDNWRDRSLASSITFFSERPRQVSRVLDALLADPEWKDRIPSGHIGVIGHSAGGFTVLALAGAIADPQRVADHCATVADDAGFCALRGKSSEEARAAEKSTIKASEFDVMDKRIRAVVAMAPLGQALTPESFKRVTVPLKIYVAEHDTVLNGKYHGGAVHAQLPAAGFEEVKNAGHFAFMAEMTQSFPSAAGNPNANPEGFDRKAFHGRLASEVTAFFDKNM